MAISNKVGPPVTGDDFYGRVEELSRAHVYLDSNHSLVLSAPANLLEIFQKTNVLLFTFNIPKRIT